MCCVCVGTKRTLPASATVLALMGLEEISQNTATREHQLAVCLLNFLSVLPAPCHKAQELGRGAGSCRARGSSVWARGAAAKGARARTAPALLRPRQLLLLNDARNKDLGSQKHFRLLSDSSNLPFAALAKPNHCNQGNEELRASHNSESWVLDAILSPGEKQWAFRERPACPCCPAAAGGTGGTRELSPSPPPGPAFSHP